MPRMSAGSAEERFSEMVVMGIRDLSSETRAKAAGLVRPA
jgi:hypothetical protein